MIRAAVAACVLLSACGRAPVRRCDDDLGGVWRGPAGSYHLLDLRGRLELYPTFRDLPTDLPAGVVAAPSVLDLTRTAGNTLVRGTVSRRYERGASFCTVSHPATLLRCGDDRLAIELIVPQPPTDWSSCADGSGAVTTLELTRSR